MLILGMLIILFDDSNPNYFDLVSVYFGCNCRLPWKIWLMSGLALSLKI